MTHLVIGGGGFVGSGLCDRLSARGIDTRATNRPGFDLSAPDFSVLPTDLTHVYLVAAMTKFAECEGSALAWMVNVDAPIAIARHCRTPAGPLGFKMPFIIFISSDAVETMGHTAYGRQKAQAEAYMQSINAAIVRPGKIQPWSLPIFCDFVINVALEKRAGVTRWT